MMRGFTGTLSAGMAACLACEARLALYMEAMLEHL